MQPWVSNSIKKCIVKQKRLDKDTIVNSHCISIVDSYKKYKSCLQRLIRNCKRQYFSDLCMKHRTNTKKLWGVINEIIKKEKNKTNVVDCLSIDGIKTCNAAKIAKEFGQHFSMIGKVYADKTKKSDRDINHYNQKISENPKTMFLSPITHYDIAKLVDSLKRKNSSGYDDVSNCLLKDIKSAIINPLVIIFNKFFSESHFPSKMKKVEVVPLYKSKDKTNKNNYRPISLLLTLSKLLEKAMYQRTYQFLEDTNQIYDGQFGFRNRHSCEHAVENLVSDIIKQSANGLFTMAVIIDLWKAFDTLSHPILLDKMCKYGIRGLSLDWFSSYLENRTIRVKCQTSTAHWEFSDEYDISYGMPQDSCLGPLLFSVFTNDIHKHLLYVKCILFADDTTLYMSHRNRNYLSWCIVHDLQTISDWFRPKLFTLNEDKLVCMTFNTNCVTSGNIISGCNIKVNGVVLPEVPHTHFLGLWIDNKLQWTVHLS